MGLSPVRALPLLSSGLPKSLSPHSRGQHGGRGGGRSQRKAWDLELLPPQFIPPPREGEASLKFVSTGVSLCSPFKDSLLLSCYGFPRAAIIKCHQLCGLNYSNYLFHSSGG